jgi:MFS family permease
MVENSLSAIAVSQSDEGIWSGARRPLTVGLVLTVASAAFEAIAVATAMPATTRELGGLALYGWTFSAFMLANLVGITLAGPAADRLGPARPMALGVALFMAGLLGAGLAPAMGPLIAARAVQGLGGGMIGAVAYVAIGRGYSESAKPRMIAITSTAWVVPGLIGPAAAGLISDTVGWRWVFLGLLPLPLIGAALALPALRRMGRPDEGPTTEDRGPWTVDRAPRAQDQGLRTEEPSLVFGRRMPKTSPKGSSVARLWSSVFGRSSPVLNALQLAGGVGLFMAGLGQGSPLYALGLAAAGAAVALPALRRMLPAGTLRAARGMPAAVAAMGLLNLAFFGVDAFVPLALAEVRGQSIAASGLPLTAATLTWTAGSWVLAHLAGRVSRRAIAVTGMALIVVGIAGVIVTLQPSVTPLAGTAAWAVAGLGIGLAYSTMSLAVLESAPPGQEGSASSAMQVAGQLGIALGTGVGGTIIGAGSSDVSAERIALQCALMVAVALAGAVVSWRITKG